MMNKLKFHATVAVVTLFAAGCATTKPPQVGQHGQTLTKRITKTITARYWLYLPDDYGKDKATRWPLILFLHGAGERGDNLDAVKVHGPPKLVAQGKKFPFIIVSPQCPSNQWWDVDVLNALLDDVIAHYAVDEDRVYCTGLSMGGFGSWSLAMAYPHRFAAIAPICGGGEPIRVARIKHLPVWVFHGGKDDVVPLKRAQEMVDALKRVGGDVQLTVYPNAGHDSWTQTYDNPQLYDWFLQHRRQK